MTGSPLVGSLVWALAILALATNNDGSEIVVQNLGDCINALMAASNHYEKKRKTRRFPGSDHDCQHATVMALISRLGADLRSGPG